MTHDFGPYEDANAIAVATGCTFADWLTDRGNEYVAHLASELGVPVADLIRPNMQVHRMVAMSFAVWASPTLHVKVCQGIAGVIAGEDKYEQAVSRQALQREFDKLKQPRDIPFRRCP